MTWHSAFKLLLSFCFGMDGFLYPVVLNVGVFMEYYVSGSFDG